ncbi:MAG: ribbon-helix-helix domain-containing protein [Candidatus Contendobacter sp.]|nr:ribbon-helix-helix domain-containing protein [Candidatus Contendobacter sp.]MDG4558222.1 ribbon-helix-helix domain-containing protein [Candidatus Contendobacter sp.]
MANRKVASSTATTERTVRASVSFPEQHYLELEQIAKRQKVSMAWVIRDAVEEYLKARWPLLENSKSSRPEREESQ